MGMTTLLMSTRSVLFFRWISEYKFLLAFRVYLSRLPHEAISEIARSRTPYLDGLKLYIFSIGIMLKSLHV